MLVVSREMYARYAWRAQTDSGYIENPDGETLEISLQYIGEVQARKEEEFHGNRETLEKYGAWWQKRSDFNGFLGINIADWELDFDNHYYIVTYGRPVSSLYCDTRKWNAYGDEDWAGYDAHMEFEEGKPYRSGVVYVYEMDRIDLAETEF